MSILKSLRDGTFTIKILNRLSHIKYVPGPSAIVDQYIVEQYTDQGWKSLSSSARRAWLQFSPVFNKHELHTIACIGAHVGKTVLDLDAAFPGCVFYMP